MKFLIFANAPDKLDVICTKDYDKIIALDGIAKHLNEIGFRYDFLIGDFDSLHPDEISQIKNTTNVEVLQDSDQNSTDLCKAIKLCDELGAAEVDIVNGLGGRLDHSLNNIRTLKRFYNPHRVLRLISGNQSVQYYQDCDLTLTGYIGEYVGILSAPLATVTSSGLQYDMEKLKLEYGYMDSTSNKFAKTSVNLSVEGGILIVREI